MPPAPAGSGGKGGGGGRRQICLSHLENEVVDEALDVLADLEPNLFRRGDALVQIVRRSGSGDGALARRRGDAPGARAVDDARVRELLATHCEFLSARQTKAGVEWRPAHPPQWASRAILGRFEWPRLPVLEGVVEGPVLRADGSVLQQPGYDPASGLYLAPQVDFEPVPEQPAPEQVDEALTRLQAVVCDFPFSGPEHFSAWLASLLTPLSRFAFEGPSPLNLIDANVRGAGKTLLADVCHMIVTGRPAPHRPYPRDESEPRKAITAIALSARQVVVLDNVRGVFGSATLELALTSTTWEDRLLGKSANLELPLLVTWYVTGNNIQLGGDMARRCLHVRLDSPREKPETRTDFHQPRLLEWARGERRRLLPAALTLLRAFVCAGRPVQDLRGLGSYESWSDLVRATVVWLGLPDPAATCGGLETAADVETAARKAMVLGLEELLAGLGGAATTQQILAELDDGVNGEKWKGLRAAFDELFPRLKKGELPTARQLGIKLGNTRDRVFEGARVEQLPRSREGVLWTVERR